MSTKSISARTFSSPQGGWGATKCRPLGNDHATSCDTHAISSAWRSDRRTTLSNFAIETITSEGWQFRRSESSLDAGAKHRRDAVMKELRKQDAWGLGRPRVMIFDVNETLIDFQSLNPLFKKTFGDEKVLREWLGHLILYSMTLTMSGLYKDYWDIGRGVFRMVGGIHKIDVTDDDVEALKKGMQTMPAWPDCKEGLTKLKDTGFRLVTHELPAPDGRRQEPARALWHRRIV